jgi:hypothetical protein
LNMTPADEESSVLVAAIPITDAFIELMRALNPFTDDLVRQPKFHRFMDLPVEIRLLVYEEYFSNDTKSLTCEEWMSSNKENPPVKISTWNPRLRFSAPFLPSLCIVSHTLRDEVIPLLLNTLRFRVYSDGDIKHFLRKMDLCPSLPIPQNIWKLSFIGVSGVDLLVRRKAQRDLVREAALESNRTRCQLIARCPNLRKLGLKFRAPLERMTGTLPYFRYRSVPIDEFLEGFDLWSILRLGNLQRLRITGIARMMGREVTGNHGHTTLQGVADLAQKIKDGFNEKKQNVAVHVCLQYPEGVKQERIL